jgi:hypothetical protein
MKAEGISLSDLSLVVQNSNLGFFESGNDYFQGDVCSITRLMFRLLQYRTI